MLLLKKKIPLILYFKTTSFESVILSVTSKHIKFPHKLSYRLHVLKHDKQPVKFSRLVTTGMVLLLCNTGSWHMQQVLVPLCSSQVVSYFSWFPWWSIHFSGYGIKVPKLTVRLKLVQVRLWIMGFSRALMIVGFCLSNQAAAHTVQDAGPWLQSGLGGQRFHDQCPS